MTKSKENGKQASLEIFKTSSNTWVWWKQSKYDIDGLPFSLGDFNNSNYLDEHDPGDQEYS